jgi:hypothetical protein
MSFNSYCCLVQLLLYGFKEGMYYLYIWITITGECTKTDCLIRNMSWIKIWDKMLHLKFMFSKKFLPQKLTKSSPLIWHYVVIVKFIVKISSIFVAFWENTNFTSLLTYQTISCIFFPTSFSFLARLWGKVYSYIYFVSRKTLLVHYQHRLQVHGQ